MLSVVTEKDQAAVIVVVGRFELAFPPTLQR
jgi:hypothetical protein